jgi:hypothetical protein
MKPVLVKKALPRHWSKDFDTVEEAMREAQAARMASKRELGNIEDIPITPGTLEWELGLTRDGKARSLIPGVSAGRVIDQGLVDQGGAFAYPALRQSFFPSLHPEVTGRRAGVPLGRGSENMMMFTTEKPRLHATQKEGREQTEAFYPGGFDPAQTYLLSDPTKTFRRNDLEEANRAFMGRNESNYAEGTEGADTPVGRIVAPMSNLVSSSQNPLTVQPWGRPQTVEDVFQLSEPMDIAMRLLKMPLIPESIKRVSDNRAEAQFQDPITNQVYPMVAEKDPKYRTMNVGIYPNQPGQNLGAPSVLDAMDMTDKDIDEDVKEMLGLGLSNAELTETIEDNPYYESDMTWTDPEKRRRGYASALYDLVNQLGEHKVRPSDNQSYEGKQLWSKRMLPKGEPMDIAMRLLKNEPVDYADTYQRVRNNTGADGEYMTDEELNAIDERYSELHDDEKHLEEYYNLLEAIELEKKRRAEGSFDGLGHNEETGFTRSEPMDIAFQLLKDDNMEEYMEDAFDLGSPLLSYDELHDKQKQIVDTIAGAPSSYWNDPASGELETENYSGMFQQDEHHLYPDEAFDEYLRYIQHFHDASAKISAMPHEEQMKIMSHYSNQHMLPNEEKEEHPLHPAKVALDKMAEEHEHWNVEDPHGDFYDRYNEPKSSQGGASRMAGGFHRSEPMDIAMRLLKGKFGPTDEEIPSLEDFDSWYNQHYKTTPQQAYGSGDVEQHLGLYDQNYYNPLSMDKRITEATKDALPEVVRNYPNLSQFNQAPIFIEQDEDNALGRHLKNNNGMGIVNLLAADAHEVADEPYQEMKRTMQHELGHGIIDNALANYDEHEEMGGDIPQPLRNIADWHDDDDEGLVEELPHSIYDKDLDRSRWNTINDYYKVASEPMEIAFQLLKERVSPEAKRHKLEYDKKYESSPERVKYREDLNRERRRRGIYGSHDHKDISHTEGGKLTLEGEHENRARHFKDKGTLREL